MRFRIELVRALQTALEERRDGEIVDDGGRNRRVDLQGDLEGPLHVLGTCGVPKITLGEADRRERVCTQFVDAELVRDGECRRSRPQTAIGVLGERPRASGNGEDARGRGGSGVTRKLLGPCYVRPSEFPLPAIPEVLREQRLGLRRGLHVPSFEKRVASLP